MNFKPAIPIKWKSIFITIVIYSVTILILATINFKFNKELTLSEVYIEFKKYEKQIIKQEVVRDPVIMPASKNNENFSNENQTKSHKANVEKSKSNNIIDTNMYLTEDSTRIYENWIDSMVINNSNLIMLKYALKNQIENSPIKKSDSLKTIETIRKNMQNYFRSKYPTPLYKFGDKPQGIPIENILDIFIGKDTVDVERIKKYLKLDEYE